MQIHVNDLQRIRGNLVDFVTRNNVTVIVAKAPSMPEPEPKYPRHIDYINLMGIK